MNAKNAAMRVGPFILLLIFVILMALAWLGVGRLWDMQAALVSCQANQPPKVCEVDWMTQRLDHLSTEPGVVIWVHGDDLAPGQPRLYMIMPADPSKRSEEINGQGCHHIIVVGPMPGDQR